MKKRICFKVGRFLFMANEINISLEELEDKISELKEMKNELASNNSGRKGKKPELSGGGQVVSILEMIAQEYNNIYDTFLLLMDNSIQFLDNAKNSMQNADNSASDAIKK